MKAGRLFSLCFACVLLATMSVAAGATPLAGPCAPGTAYDPACDVNHDGVVNVLDVQLTAGHWNQTGTFTSDNNHNHLGQTWTGSNNPMKIQGAFGAPDYTPLLLSNSTGHGLAVTSAAIDGIYVGTAGYYGLAVQHADKDGVLVVTAGSPSSNQASTESNGFEVAGAESSGLYVGRADDFGVNVASAGLAGVNVESVGSTGVYVGSAGGNGVSVNSASLMGVVVSSAGGSGVYANTTNASGQWGFYTPDRIFGTIGMFSALSLVAQVTGPDSLTPGDIVAVAGVTDPVPGSTVHTPLVRLAGGTFTNVVGVVESHLALTEKPSHAQPAESETDTETPPSELRSVDGPAQAGDYVAITVLGAAQVKVDDAASIEAGQRLTVAETLGHARALRTVQVEGVKVDESGPTLGAALEAADKNGLVWVLVNPQ